MREKRVRGSTVRTTAREGGKVKVPQELEQVFLQTPWRRRYFPAAFGEENGRADIHIGTDRKPMKDQNQLKVRKNTY